MIKFKNIRFKNFLSYGNSFTEIWLDYKPNTVLVGESGSGKSSVTDAISFALFGKPFRPIQKNQLVNSINNSECIVEIDFEIGTNDYRVRRGIKPNIFEIYCNDVLLNQDSHTKDYQDHLEKTILNMNFRTFTHIVVLGAANFVPFMQLKPNDRRILIEDLLDIQVFSTMSLLLKEKISNSKSILSHNNSEIQTYKEKIDIYNKYINDLKKDKQRQIEENEKKIEENQISVEENRQQIKIIDQKISELKQLIQDEEKIVSKIKTYSEYQKDIETNLKKLKKELSFYEKNATCPTCNRDFDKEYKESVVLEKHKKENELISGVSVLQKNLDKLSIRYSEIAIVQKDIRCLKDDITQKEIEISSVLHFVKKIRSENDDLRVKQKDVTEETGKLEQLNEQLVVLENEKKKLAHDKLIFEIATNLLKDGGIKSKIIKQYLPVINKLVNRFLASMNFYVTFTIDENFNETIKSRGRDDFTYSCFSEGERQRLDIAILLTWRTIATMKNSVRTNLLFIDELLDSSLDQIATENIIELINNETILKNSNIFVISHKTTMIDKFSEYIKFEKVKNFSKVIP